MLLQKNLKNNFVGYVVKGGLTTGEKIEKDGKVQLDFAFSVWDKEIKEEISKYARLVFGDKQKEMLDKLELKKGTQMVVFGGAKSYENTGADGKVYKSSYIFVNRFALADSSFDLCHYFETESNGKSFRNLMMTGRLTRDPEMGTTQSGQRILNFTIATNNGKDSVRFTRCSLWENEYNKKRIEFLSTLKKGTKLYVDGSPRKNTWKDKDGNEHNDEDLSVFNLQVIKFPKKESDSLETQDVSNESAKSEESMITDFDSLDFGDTENIPF